MGASTPRHHSSSSSPFQRSLHSKRIVTFALYALVPLALLHYLLSFPPSPAPTTSSPSPPQGSKVAAAAGAAGGAAKKIAAPRCDYSDGAWERSEAGPLYNGTSCGDTIKAGQNCEAARAARHGVPPLAVAAARVRAPAVRPRRVPAPRPRPPRRVRGRLAGAEPVRVPRLPAQLRVPGPAGAWRRRGRRGRGRRRAPQVPALGVPVAQRHGVRLLVAVPGERHGEGQGGGGRAGPQPAVPGPAERAVGGGGPRHRRGGALGGALVPALGALLRPRRGGGLPPLPGAEPHGDGLLRGVPPRRPWGAPRGRSPRRQGRRAPKLAVLTTFSPAHFEGDWDSPTACARTEPYAPGERAMEYMDAEMLRAEAEEAAAAAADARARGARVTVETLQVTRMAGLRADGHPGAYMHSFPFAGGARERVPNDCVHWCLPGPIDTWNEILLQIVKRWADGVDADAWSSSSP